MNIIPSLNYTEEELLDKIETQLASFLTTTLTQENNTLLEAMCYSTLNGGKRIRPLLTIAGGLISGANLDTLIYVGSAIELIHCFSLIHDDLPIMDNDDYRRGRLSCHKKYSEAIALLAGDALQTLAFEKLSEQSFKLNVELKIKIINLIARAVGFNGMAGGQALDLINTGCTLNLNQLQDMHLMKTGELIKSAVLSGYYCGATFDQSMYNKLEAFCDGLGLLFQITDDILDYTSDTLTLGKTAMKDTNQNKATYVTHLGIDMAQKFALEIYLRLLKEISNFDNHDYLKYLTEIVYKRCS